MPQTVQQQLHLPNHLSRDNMPFLLCLPPIPFSTLAATWWVNMGLAVVADVQLFNIWSDVWG